MPIEMSPPVFVCLCHAVTEEEVLDAVDSGATSEEEVADLTFAGTGCGSCLERLGDLQDTLKRLKKLRLHVYPVSPENQPEARPKNLSKLSAANVIPFPLLARGSEASADSRSSSIRAAA